MANSIFPDVGSGAVVIRDADGNCLAPPDVHNAYCPPATYDVDCAMTAIPSTCEARIEPRQINAIVSELVAFAECLDPDGPWDCNALNNLCTAFQAWVATYEGSIEDLFVDVAGDTMTGPLLLPIAAPVAPEEAANKKYVDDKILAAEGLDAANFVNVIGDTMTGPLVLPAAAPTLPEHAAHKDYVDDGDAATLAAALATSMQTAGGQTITGGFALTPNNLGNIPTPFTPNPLLGNYQYGTNNAAATWNIPAVDCAMDILVTNGATAGAITFSGYTVSALIGDALTTTNTNKFIISIRRINAVATYTVKALQ